MSTFTKIQQTEELLVPISSPKESFFAHREEIVDAIESVLESGWYILGKQVERFEQTFAGYLGAKECIGVGNGTDALALALKGVGVEAGDEVITVSHSAVATVAAIEQIGAVPVFCDIEETTRCLDPTLLSVLVTPKTKAVVPVHIYGHPARLAEILEVAKRHRLFVVEDCAQAHGAEYDGKKVGTFGDAAAFSFYPTKNLGALGDGGAVVTNSPQIGEKVRLFRQYGWKERYVSIVPGVNSRLDELQAAILLVKLSSLDEDNKRRREIAACYKEALLETKIKPPTIADRVLHAMHLYVIEHQKRELLQEHLRTAGIQTALHYPLPIHLQPAYLQRKTDNRGLPVTETLYKNILSLPMYPELSGEQVEHVCAALRSFK